MLTAEDADTIARYLAGERDAVARVDGWIAGATGSWRERLGPAREDLEQEVRLTLLGLLGRGAFRGDASLKTYVWRVTQHACLHWLRGRSRWRFVAEEVLAEVPSPDPPPSGRLVAEAGRRELWRVFARLPAECREIWRLVLAGCSYAVMSERLGVAEGTLRVRALRCRRRAREHLEAAALAPPVTSRPPGAQSC